VVHGFVDAALQSPDRLTRLIRKFQMLQLAVFIFLDAHEEPETTRHCCQHRDRSDLGAATTRHIRPRVPGNS
jgi:hypothetical protein